MSTRVNPVGWFLVLFFLVGGIVFWRTIPEIFIGQIWVAVSLLLIVIYTAVGWRGRAAARLRSEGIPGHATILGMTQTGTYVNEQPLVKLQLRVEAPGVETRDVDKRVVVPLIALGTLTSGRPLTIYIDPEDHEKFTIDWGAAMALGASVPAPAPAAPAAQVKEEPLERLNELMRLKGAGLISDDEFEAQRKRIIESV